MSAMLTKELLYLKRQKRVLYSVLILSVVFVPLMITQSHSASAAEKGITLSASLGVIMAMLAAMVIINNLASDEKAKWDSYARSLPISAAKIIGAKYVFLLILTFIGMVLGILVDLIAMGFHVDGNTLLLLCAVTGGVSPLMCALEIPLALKFGLQKANLFVICIFCLGPLLLSRIFPGNITGVSESQVFFLLKLSPLAMLAVLGISFYISCAIYKHRQQ